VWLARKYVKEIGGHGGLHRAEATSGGTERQGAAQALACRGTSPGGASVPRAYIACRLDAPSRRPNVSRGKISLPAVAAVGLLMLSHVLASSHRPT
jgi:hypothetical protein